MVLREQDKHFLWSFYVAVAVILTWKGVSEGFSIIPFFDDPWIVLFISFTILTLTGLIMREYDPLGSVQKSAEKIINHILHREDKNEFLVKYNDKQINEILSLSAENLIELDDNVLVFEHKKDRKEIFIPLDRIEEIQFKGEVFWRL